MIGFEVSHNGLRLCTAGVGEHGVLSAVVSWTSRNPKTVADLPPEDCEASSHEELRLDVGGVVGETRHDWTSATLQPGDEVLVRISEIQTPDAPSRSRTFTAKDMLENQQAYVRHMCQEWGWKIAEA
jgi:hypothetical protein